MNTLRSPAAGDTVELIDEDGGLGVTYRLRQCCCGSKKRLLTTLIVAVLVVGCVATLTYFLTRSKFEAYCIEMFIYAPNTLRFPAYETGAYLLKRGFIPKASGPSSGFNSPVVTLSSSPTSVMLSDSRFIFLGFA